MFPPLSIPSPAMPQFFYTLSWAMGLETSPNAEFPRKYPMKHQRAVWHAGCLCRHSTSWARADDFIDGGGFNKKPCSEQPLHTPWRIPLVSTTFRRGVAPAASRLHPSSLRPKADEPGTRAARQ